MEVKKSRGLLGLLDASRRESAAEVLKGKISKACLEHPEICSSFKELSPGDQRDLLTLLQELRRASKKDLIPPGRRSSLFLQHSTGISTFLGHVSAAKKQQIPGRST
jgi:hypothetical protein